MIQNTDFSSDSYWIRIMFSSEKLLVISGKYHQLSFINRMAFAHSLKVAKAFRAVGMQCRVEKSEPTGIKPYCPQREVIRYPPKMMDNAGLANRHTHTHKKSHLLSSRWDRLDASAQTTHPSSDLLVRLVSQLQWIMMDIKATVTQVTMGALLQLPVFLSCHQYTLKIYLSLLLCTGSSHLQFITYYRKFKIVAEAIIAMSTCLRK